MEGKSRTEKRRTVERARDRLAARLGREPTRAEVVVELAAAVTNPAVYVSTVGRAERRMVAASQLGDDDRADDGAGLPEPVDHGAADPAVVYRPTASSNRIGW